MLSLALVLGSKINSQQLPGSDSFGDARWKIVSDPRQRYSLGLLPPSHVHLTSSIDIQEAISFTPEARIVTTSTPPFSVVHANKAFLQKADCSSRDLIGNPIESIIHVTDVIPVTAGGQSQGVIIEGVLSVAGSGEDKPCRIRVVPVTDRQSSCLSHVMIQIEDDGSHEEAACATEARSSRVSAPGRRASQDLKSYPQEMVGAVG